MGLPSSDPARSDLALPTVRVAVGPALVAAGVRALLSTAGFVLHDQSDVLATDVLATDMLGADVLVIDDSWLPDPEALAGVSAVVALGSAAWATLLPELIAGGWAALPADATATELIAGVLGASAGLAVLPPGLLAPPAPPDEDEPDFPASDVSLTPRERDVLALLAGGLSNKRIARDLGISESTVKFHVAALYSKLGMQSRAGAVTRGIQLGLVSV